MSVANPAAFLPGPASRCPAGLPLPELGRRRPRGRGQLQALGGARPTCRRLTPREATQLPEASPRPGWGLADSESFLWWVIACPKSSGAGAGDTKDRLSMENDYNPQDSTGLSERKTGLRVRSKGDWPGSAKAAARRSAACAGSHLSGRICGGAGARCPLSAPGAES